LLLTGSFGSNIAFLVQTQNNNMCTVDTRYLDIGYLDTPDMLTYLYFLAKFDTS